MWPCFVLLLFSGLCLTGAQPKKILYVTATAGYRHSSIETSQNVLQELADWDGRFEVVVTEDVSMLNSSTLKDFEAVFFFTSGELPLSDRQKADLLAFVESGKGFGGVHSATDTLYSWPEYGRLIGARFDGHPWVQKAGVRIDDTGSEIVGPLAPEFDIVEEFYQFRDFDRSRMQVLESIDTTTVDLGATGVHRTDGDFPLTWTQAYGDGRVFYTALGHFEETWGDARFQAMMARALAWLVKLKKIYCYRMTFPRLVPVRQNFPDRRIHDIPAEVARQLGASGFGARLKPGARVAIGVGSRGISNIALIVRSVVDFWKAAGFNPFLFPAMGSHGAATAEGQADVLAHYGIHEATMGCPVVSQLEVVSLGSTEDGIEAFMDRVAHESDGVFLINRVKWHTDFAGGIESGLFKMMAIGLGKFAGAQRYHTYAYKIGLEHVIRSVGRQVLGSGKILGGLAILEDAHHNTAKLDAVPVEVMEQREEENLALVKTWMGKIPMPLDILILDELGKNYSGAGMDTKVVNRSVWGQSNSWDVAPRIERIHLRGISSMSYGNAVGIGMADVVHARLLSKVNWHPTRINSLTASTPHAIKTPISFSTDRECIEQMMPTVGKVDLKDVTFGWIRNSLDIATLALSENLLDQVRANPLLEVLGPAQDFPLDAHGNLPECGEFLGIEQHAHAH